MTGLKFRFSIMNATFYGQQREFVLNSYVFLGLKTENDNSSQFVIKQGYREILYLALKRFFKLNKWINKKEKEIFLQFF